MDTVVLERKMDKDGVAIDTNISRVVLCTSGRLLSAQIKLLMLKTLLCFRGHRIRELATGDPEEAIADGFNPLDVHGSVYHNTVLIEMTNRMQLCRTIYYSIVS
jgi:hypothetical protein